MAGDRQIRYLKKSRRRRTGPVLFSMMRNESYHLPFFLDHYRNIGVADFLIYDDSSSDGTTELLLSQSDVSVITSDVPFGAKVDGHRRWTTVVKQLVPNTIIKKGWAIIADADEYLYLPSEFSNIIEFIRFLESQGSDCVSASLVDFYPERLAMRIYSQKLSPKLKSLYFDKGKLFEWTPGEISPQPLSAGVRARLAQQLEQHHAQEYRKIFNAEWTGLAKTWKTPLIRCGSKAVLWNGHNANVPPPENVQLAFAHYKFTPDLDSKISYALSSNAYYSNSVEYVFLDAALRYFEDLPLVGPESVKFKDVTSLEKAGHIFVR